MIAEYENGVRKKDHVYMGNQLFATFNGGIVHYHHPDHLGTLRLRTNTAGAVQSRHDFYPFGGERNPPATSETHKFTGQERDAETGLDYFIARHYTSNMGRFLQPDPLLNSGRPGNPQTWNRYTYTLNNPLKFTDPTGLFVFVPPVNNCDEGDEACNRKFQRKLDEYERNKNRFLRALARLNDALANATPGTLDYAILKAAIDAIGKENVPNGVFVTFSEIVGSAAINLDTDSDDEGNLSFTLTVDPSKNSRINSFAGNIGHEGRHISDSRNIDLRNAMSDFTLEFRGYETQVSVGRNLGVSSVRANGIELWNRSWNNIDKTYSGVMRLLKSLGHSVP